MSTARCRLLELFLLASLAAAPAGAVGLYLHVLPVTVSPEVVKTPEAPLGVTLVPTDPGRLDGDWLRALGASVIDGEVVLTLDAYPQLSGGVTEAHLQPSFVIDFDEPDVLQLEGRLVAAHGPSPGVAELVRFTDESIPEKTLARGWDLASRVARHGEGDCTEHAVLLTALARATGRPSRVAIGIVLVWHVGSVAAYGHAWSEIHDGSRWQPADASSIDREGPVRYLPQMVMTDEGPGYGVRLMGGLMSSQPKSLEIGLLSR